jgi:RimJ/RimL family protein N-acetyltransferase
MPGPAFLYGDRVALRTVEEEDLKFLQRNRNDPRVRAGMTTTEPRNGLSMEQAHERHSEDTDSAVGFLVTDETDETPIPVGQVVLFDMDTDHGNGELATWVDPDHWGEGYATEGTAVLLDHAFFERRLHHVRARALETNEGSRTVLENLGLEREGVQREEKFVDGQYVDVVCYGVLAREWERAYPQERP